MHPLQRQDEGAVCKGREGEDKVQEMQQQQAAPQGEGKKGPEGLGSTLKIQINSG